MIMLHEFSILKMHFIPTSSHVQYIYIQIEIKDFIESVCLLESEFAYEFHRDEKHLNCWLSGYFIIKRKTIHISIN